MCAGAASPPGSSREPGTQCPGRSALTTYLLWDPKAQRGPAPSLGHTAGSVAAKTQGRTGFFPCRRCTPENIRHIHRERELQGEPPCVRPPLPTPILFRHLGLSSRPHVGSGRPDPRGVLSPACALVSPVPGKDPPFLSDRNPVSRPKRSSDSSHTWATSSLS